LRANQEPTTRFCSPVPRVRAMVQGGLLVDVTSTKEELVGECPAVSLQLVTLMCAHHTRSIYGTMSDDLRPRGKSYLAMAIAEVVEVFSHMSPCHA